tara:strand:- start:5370 stop:6272 length:903 start_codon:yes stop_codon:yes gene_type:complete
MIKIYGLGNALIDVQISINEEDLKKINIPKDSMRHISAKERDQLLNEYRAHILNFESGGSIANTLFSANEYGCETYFGCSLGNDDNGKMFLNGFTDTKHTNVINQSLSPTGICLIFITPDGKRTMAANLGANKDLSLSCIKEEYLRSSDWLIFDSYLLSTKNGFVVAKKAIEIAQSSKLQICFGLGDISLIKLNKQKIKWLLSQEIDYIVGNRNEFEEFIKFFPNSKTSKLITLDSKGARLNNIHVNAPKIKSINSNGAGDALLGVFIANLQKNGEEKSLKESVKYASSLCLTIVSRFKK